MFMDHITLPSGSNVQKKHRVFSFSHKLSDENVITITLKWLANKGKHWSYDIALLSDSGASINFQNESDFYHAQESLTQSVNKSGRTLMIRPKELESVTKDLKELITATVPVYEASVSFATGQY